MNSSRKGLWTVVMQQYPPPLSLSETALLREYAIDWALAHGLVYRPAATPPVPNPAATVTHAPVSLLPSPFPRQAFQTAVNLQPILNQLVHAVSNDNAFLAGIMDSIATVDDFTGRIYDIYKIVRKEGIRQKISLGINRSDYILHVPIDAPAHTEPIVQQVEINTIASSFSSLSTVTGELHRYLLSRTNYFQTSKNKNSPQVSPESLPINASGTAIARGIARAYALYGKPDSVVVMVVQPNERNVFDQRMIEDVLWREHQIKLLRRTLAEIRTAAKIRESDGALVLRRDDQEVSVVYYRAGYGPGDYPSEAEWEARLLVERSMAIKCPNVAFHLAGAKKVQQVLAMDGVLEKFVPDRSHCERVRSCFAGLYPLDTSPAGEAAVRMALEDPTRFVMKPQREGGGNNIYGSDIPPFLEQLTASGKQRERDSYILMDLIRPPKQRNLLLRLGEVCEAEVVSELGIYGIWLSEGSLVHMNENGGHLLRTKTSGSNEGGVATGFAVIDSPSLVDKKDV